MDGQQQIQRTVEIAQNGFNFLMDFALPISIGITVTVVSGIILYFLKKNFRKKNR